MVHGISSNNITGSTVLFVVVQGFIFYFYIEVTFQLVTFYVVVKTISHTFTLWVIVLLDTCYMSILFSNVFFLCQIIICVVAASAKEKIRIKEMTDCERHGSRLKLRHLHIIQLILEIIFSSVHQIQTYSTYIHS